MPKALPAKTIPHILATIQVDSLRDAGARDLISLQPSPPRKNFILIIREVYVLLLVSGDLYEYMLCYIYPEFC